MGLGLAAGMLTAHAGASPERALGALFALAAGLGPTGLSLGVTLGLVNDRVGVVIAVATALGSYYVGTWIGSPWHSPAGDALVLLASATSTCLAAAVGFGAERSAARHRRKSVARSGAASS